VFGITTNWKRTQRSSAAPPFRYRYGLRTLFVVMTMACVGAWGVRIFCFHQQARYHHRQVDLQVHESTMNFAADLPYSEARWERVRQHMHLASVYDYASCHPWLTLADAQAEVNRVATRLPPHDISQGPDPVGYIAYPPTTPIFEGTNDS